jgi:hypothetical protein
MKFDFIIVLFIAVVASFIWTSVSLVFGAQQFMGQPMNASISQPICITISTNYTQGVFFTNTSTIGTQYPITDTMVLNNATDNYINATGTAYWIQSCGSNKVNVSSYHCACDNLKCSGGGCAVGADIMNVSYSAADGGVGWANNTTFATVVHAPPNNNFYFSTIDSYQLVGGQMNGTSYIFLRYWIDPRPNTVPSGTYNTTYNVRAVEYATAVGSCTC